LKQLIKELRNQEPINPESSIMVAGDPEKIVEIERSRNGIPISNFEKLFLKKLSQDYNVDLVI